MIVNYTGEVSWLSHGIFKSSCKISVEYFPFDIQNCKLKWASWTYDGLSVRRFPRTVPFTTYVRYIRTFTFRALLLWTESTLAGELALASSPLVPRRILPFPEREGKDTRKKGVAPSFSFSSPSPSFS